MHHLKPQEVASSQGHFDSFTQVSLKTCLVKISTDPDNSSLESSQQREESGIEGADQQSHLKGVIMDEVFSSISFPRSHLSGTPGPDIMVAKHRVGGHRMGEETEGWKEGIDERHNKAEREFLNEQLKGKWKTK